MRGDPNARLLKNSARNPESRYTVNYKRAPLALEERASGTMSLRTLLFVVIITLVGFLLM